MIPPDVRSTIVDEANQVTYHVMAYRQLTRDELVDQVRAFLSQPKIRRRKTPVRNRTITIVTILGATKSL